MIRIRQAVRSSKNAQSNIDRLVALNTLPGFPSTDYAAFVSNMNTALPGLLQGLFDTSVIGQQPNGIDTMANAVDNLQYLKLLEPNLANLGLVDYNQCPYTDGKYIAVLKFLLLG
jgi:hypothetical protein